MDQIIWSEGGTGFRMTRRKAYIVEDSGIGEAPAGPIVRFRLLSEDEGAAIIRHLGSYPTLSMESYRGIPLSGYWTSTSSEGSGRPSPEEARVGVYTILDGMDPVREGEKINVVGGLFAMGMLAAQAEVRARWGGKVRSPEFAKQLPAMEPPLPTIVQIEL
ncbi:MAG: hypothetical protein WA549_03110 [Thermoplasmata archaeon]